MLLGTLKPYLYRARWVILLSLSILLVADLLGSSLPLFIRHGIDVDIENKDVHGLMNTVKMLLLILLGSLITQVSSTYMMAYVGQKILYQLRVDLLQKIFRLPTAYFDQTPSGQVLTHVTNDVESIRRFISEGIVSVLSSFAKIVFIVAFMLYLSPWLSLVTLLSIPLFVGGTLWFKSSIREGFRQVRQANSDINTRMVESLNGHREITLFQHRMANESQFDESNKAYLNAYQSIVHAYAVYLPVVENITYLSTLAVLGVAHFTAGQVLLAGEIFAFFSLINMFFRPLRQMAEEFNTFQSAMAAMERVHKLLSEHESIENSDCAQVLDDGPLAISFEDLQFQYQEDKPVLKGLNMDIQAEETVALVGHTGAGKSTIIHLINRLYEAQSGSVRVGGVDVRDLDLRGLRSKIATIPQSVMLMEGSVLDNMRLFDDSIGREVVQEAISALGLQGFIHSLPQGLETPLGEGGSSLSEGQKQLIAFVRAWVKDPRILILDEATANVDSKTEKHIEEALVSLREGRTTILIAHRLSTIQTANRIIVLKQGLVEEEGSHRELMDRGGLYHKLYQKQSLSLQVRLDAT
jgi:ATP-binding cassette subfamily B protein